MTASRIAVRRRQRRRGSQSRGPSRGTRLLVIVGGLLAGLVIVGVAAAGGVAMYGVNRYQHFTEGVVPPEQLLAKYSSGGARIYDRNGNLLYEFVDELTGLRRPVPLREISHWLTDATVSTEDPDFYTNIGVNVRGLVRAGVENFVPFLGGGDFLQGSGGSSITQQLAKNIYIPRDERSERSVERKLKETAIALELTQKYSKDQILEWYLNSISYGGIYVGVEAASMGYFNKPASELTLAEAALLAGIPQSPARYDPYSPGNWDETTSMLTDTGLAKARQLEVLDLMEKRGVISPAQAEEARNEPIHLKQSRFDIEAPHFVLNRIKDELIARFGERALFERGLEVTTTLDLDLQHTAEQIMEKYITEFGESTGMYNGAFVALDPRTGQILVYVGSRDYFREDIEGKNDNVTALNSPGSTLKPFTFMTAFMHGWGTGTAILDTPVKIVDYATGETFSPRDPIAVLQGPLPAAKALGNSLNITAIKTILFAGVQDTIGTLKRVGYTTFDNPLGYGPALTTGGSEITLMDETIAYSVLATNGIMRGQDAITTSRLDPGERILEPIALLKVTDATGQVLYQYTEPEERRVVPAEYAYLITSIISNGQNQCITYGVCNALALPNGYPSGAKTGTSEPFENSRAIGETWTVGYTPELVAGIWAGNADNAPIVGIDSTRVSLRAWKEFMVDALAKLNLPKTPFTRPSGVVEKEVCWPSGKLPTPLCPQLNRYTSLYAAEVLPRDGEDRPEMYDSWWQEVPIDTRTGLRATAQTPAQFVHNEVRLVFPPDEVKDWPGLQAWAARYGVSSLLAPPEEAEAGPLVARLDTPAPNQTVSGQLQIRGRAASPDFQRYEVQWGRGANPSAWTRLFSSATPVASGLLATWDTTFVPNGEYAVRVIVTDAKLGERRYQVSVQVDNGAIAPPGDQATLLVISAPSDGARVSGTVSVTGIATSPNMLVTRLLVGQGVNPASFQAIALKPTPTVGQVIGQWDTTGVEDGPWTIRVEVSDQVLGDTSTQVLVVVNNGPTSP